MREPSNKMKNRYIFIYINRNRNISIFRGTQILAPGLIGPILVNPTAYISVGSVRIYS